MEKKESKHQVICRYLHYAWLAIVFAGTVYLICHLSDILAGLSLLIAGIAVALIYYARSREDEVLGTRTNFELIRFYTKTAYFLFVVLGIGFLVLVVAEKIVKPLLK